MGLNGEHEGDGSQLSVRELQLHTYRHARAAHAAQDELFTQMGALVGELSRAALSLAEVAVELRRFSRMPSQAPTPIMPAPTTNAARERQQSVHELDAMSQKLASILDVDSGVETPGEDTKVQKLRTVKSTAATLLDMVEERKRKQLARIEQRAAWTWRFQVMGAIALALPLLGSMGYGTLWVFRMLLKLAASP